MVALQQLFDLGRLLEFSECAVVPKLANLPGLSSDLA
jgi:hypothetical protein